MIKKTRVNNATHYLMDGLKSNNVSLNGQIITVPQKGFRTDKSHCYFTFNLNNKRDSSNRLSQLCAIHISENYENTFQDLIVLCISCHFLEVCTK